MHPSPRRAVVAALATLGLLTLSLAAAAPAAARQPAHRVPGTQRGAAAVRHAGAAAIAGFRAAHTQRLRALRGAQPADQLHEWWGVFPQDGLTGVTATQSVDPNLRLSDSSDFLYTPTTKPPSGSCIEAVTVHTSGTPQIWAWDWCGSVAPAVTKDVDSGFVSDYGSTVNGRTAYEVRVARTDAGANTWDMTLHNQRTGAWDEFFSSSGSDQSGWAQGWDMFEFYSDTNPSTGNTYVCDDIANETLESSSVQVQQNGSWTPASTGNSTWMPEQNPNPSDYRCPSLRFDILGANDHWAVHE